MLIDSKLRKKMRGVALNYSAMLRNCVVRDGQEKRPIELMTGKKPVKSKLIVFGSKFI